MGVEPEEGLMFGGDLNQKPGSPRYRVSLFFLSLIPLSLKLYPLSHSFTIQEQYKSCLHGTLVLIMKLLLLLWLQDVTF